jgi:hypothetical protein
MERKCSRFGYKTGLDAKTQTQTGRIKLKCYCLNNAYSLLLSSR